VASDRNKPCPCGSGRKTKRCCGVPATTAPARECGPCSACCTTLEVRALGKPGHVACPHLGDSGCSVYSERPGECRVYKCLWIQGKLRDDERPDLAGVIVDTYAKLQAVWGDAFMICEMDHDSMRTPPALAILTRLLATNAAVIVVTREGPRKFMTNDPAKRAKFAEIVERGTM